MQVNFVIGGTQKGGTTALASFLGQHPQLCMSNPKEVHFFDDEGLFDGRVMATEHYHKHFSPRSTTQLLGEATPIYMYWKPAPERIRAYNPAMKWIFLLRNPIDRAYSHYVMEQRRGYEALSFSEAIRAERQRLQSILPEQHRIYSYIDRGRYAEQIERVLRLFPPDHLLFLRSEDLRSKHDEVLNRVFTFLGVDASVRIESALLFDQAYEPMAKQDRAFLLDALAADTSRLEKLLGWNCTAWKV